MEGVFFFLPEKASNPSIVGYPHKLCAAVEPIDISCLAGQDCAMQASLRSNTTDGVSSPAACRAPSSTINAIQKRGSFQVSLNLRKSVIF